MEFSGILSRFFETEESDGAAAVVCSKEGQTGAFPDILLPCFGYLKPILQGFKDVSCNLLLFGSFGNFFCSQMLRFSLIAYPPTPGSGGGIQRGNPQGLSFAVGEGFQRGPHIPSTVTPKPRASG